MIYNFFHICFTNIFFESAKRLENTIEIFSDSQLICMQFNNKWKCKEKNLSLLLIKAQGLKKEIKSAITVNYIPRELNTIADKLAKDAIS